MKQILSLFVVAVAVAFIMQPRWCAAQRGAEDVDWAYVPDPPQREQSVRISIEQILHSRGLSY